MGMFETEKKERYVSILADGKFHETVPQGTEDAVERAFETSDGKTGKKWEMVYTKIRASITDVRFQDGDYGTNIQLVIEGEDGEATISVNTASNFGEDIMKKLPNIKLNEPIEISPFSFIDEDERAVKGVTFFQNGKKITNFFKNAETKELLHGFPAPEKDKEYDKDDWKVYFIGIRKFLIKYTQDNIIPKIKGTATKPVSPATEKAEPHNSNPDEIDAAFAAAIATDKINPDDIPF